MMNVKIILLAMLVLLESGLIYILFSDLKTMTGMFYESAIDKVYAAPMTSCGDGYCDSNENIDICDLDCPYPEIYK